MIFKDIVDWLNDKDYVVSCIGNLDAPVTGFSSLISCRPKELTWVKRQKNYEELPEKDKITVAVVQEGIADEIPNRIITQNSKEVFFGILSHFWGVTKPEGFVGEGTVISEEAEIDPTVYIGHNCSIDGKVIIGSHTVIEDNVVIMNDVCIGEDCIIHSGTVIGKDGFGYAFDDQNRPAKVPHFGGVVIGDQVEIGSNTVIDQGTLDATVIGENTKIDDLCHIAHNTIVGKNVLITGGVELSGSSCIGDYSYLSPHSCVKNQVSIGNNCFIGINVVVLESLADNMMISAVGLKPMKSRDYRRFL